MARSKASEVLLAHWGHERFRGSQDSIVAAALKGRDVLGLLPTGGGKSIAFQVPAMVLPGICIVISPLVALIEDQVNKLKQLGIKAIGLAGNLPYGTLDQVLDNCIYGNYKFLYLSPERLQQELVQQRLAQMPVNSIVVDEAHCISQWGHDFRPAYLHCARAREIHPQVPMLAMTATATPKVVQDIMTLLELRDPLVAKDSFARKNICFGVAQEEDKQYALRTHCQNLENSGIVYVRNRKATVQLAAYLGRHGVRAAAYHGGLSAQEKKTGLEHWLSGQVQVMVATNAFGMGIDKPDVGLVLHYQIPDCIENYFQEAGRAGRDGNPAKAILLANQTDQQRAHDQFIKVLPGVDFVKRFYRKLCSYFQIAYGEGSGEPFLLNFNAFCATHGLHPLLGYNTLRLLDQYSVIALSEAHNKKCSLQFVCHKTVLYQYMEKWPQQKELIQTLLRTYGGLFDFDTQVNTHLLSKKMNVSESDVHKGLEALAEAEIITYRAATSDMEITFLVPREDDRTINGFSKAMGAQQDRKKEQLRAMLSYVENNKVCRNKQLMAYFGQRETEDCGRCDVCTARRGTEDGQGTIAAITTFLTNHEASSREIVAQLGQDPKMVLKALSQMLENGQIGINTKNQYTLK
ncbi:ATP-dependent DNA helicase RecQ [Maribacter sp. 2307ULW6-5]|uniref:RecQ family ATP-dependent DNA helicase n=1 Tax=Maribacter sp. 2307ULW6-5 TaxID=3386275 RepID=UPI0039BD8B5F